MHHRIGGQIANQAAALVLSCALGWMLWSLLVGYAGHRLPLAALEHDNGLTRPRPWGETRSGYERNLRIRAWKKWLPDAGDLFPGGVRKQALVGRDTTTLRRLVAETRRAELVHVALWPFWLVTALWLPPEGVLINLVFDTAFNLPCLWVQRFNRLRLMTAIEQSSKR